MLEAVFEEIAVKKEVFAALEAVVRDESSSRRTRPRSRWRRWRRPRARGALVGMHFFNPVALMPLVELIRTPETDDATLATAAEVDEEAAQARRPRPATRPASSSTAC